MLRGQVRSCRQPKAVHPISTDEKSAVARFMKRESRTLIPVGGTESAKACCSVLTKSSLNSSDVMVFILFCLDLVFQNPCGCATWPSAWRG